MSKSLLLLNVIAGFLWLSAGQVVKAEVIVDFNDLPLNTSGYYNGDVSAGAPLRDNYTILSSNSNDDDEDNDEGYDYIQQWNTNGLTFGNTYSTYKGGWTSWKGWSWSGVADSTTPGFTNQYAAFPGGGSDGMGGTDPDGIYAVAFGGGSYVNIPSGFRVDSADFANTTYAALSMRDGDNFAKQFGGDSGNDPDFFRAFLTGFDQFNATGDVTGILQIDLADFTSEDNDLDYILDSWINVDLSALGAARSVGLTFESSDVDPVFGINTPTYLAMDNFTLTAVPEPGTFAALFVAAAYVAGRRMRRTQ